MSSEQPAEGKKHVNTVMNPKLFKEIKTRAASEGLNIGDYFGAAVIVTRKFSRQKIIEILKKEGVEVNK
jgi:hypothetical protein